MMKTKRGNLGRFGVVLTGLVLLTAACTAGGQDAGGGDRQPAGELLLAGTTRVQTLTLGQDPVTEFTYTAGAALPAVNPAENRFYLAQTIAAAPFTVETYELDTLERVGPDFTWPDMDLATHFQSLSFSSDGQLAAAVVRTVGEDELSVVRLEDDGSATELLPRHFRGKIGSDLVWLNDTELAFVLDVRDQTGGAAADYDVAIVSLDVVEEAASGGLLLDVIVGLNTSNVTPESIITDLALSPDRNTLAYSYREGAATANVMLVDLTRDSAAPRQLTDGAFHHVGAAFSPDGKSVAFLEEGTGYLSGLFIVPADASVNLRDEAAYDRHLVAQVQADRVLVWR